MNGLVVVGPCPLGQALAFRDYAKRHECNRIVRVQFYRLIRIGKRLVNIASSAMSPAAARICICIFRPYLDRVIFINDGSFVIIHIRPLHTADRIGQAVVGVDGDRGITRFRRLREIVFSLRDKRGNIQSPAVTRIKRQGLSTISRCTIEISRQKSRVGSRLVNSGILLRQINCVCEISDGTDIVAFALPAYRATKKCLS